jgi:hypothetical protein
MFKCRLNDDTKRGLTRDLNDHTSTRQPISDLGIDIAQHSYFHSKNSVRHSGPDMPQNGPGHYNLRREVQNSLRQ